MAALSDNVIILIIILAAAFVICMGFAVTRIWVKDDGVDFNQKSAPQMDYMRELRERSRMQVWNEAQAGSGKHRQYYPDEARSSQG